MTGAEAAVPAAPPRGVRLFGRRWHAQRYRVDPSAMRWFGVGGVGDEFSGRITGVSVAGPRRGLAVFFLPPGWERD